MGLLLLGIGLTVMALVVHVAVCVGLVMWLVSRPSFATARVRLLRSALRLCSFVLVLLASHLLQAGAWAWLFTTGPLPDLNEAAYFSLTSYTTAGYGDVTLTGPWRLLGTLAAVNGVLATGLSTAFMFAALSEYLNQAIARRAGRAT